MPWQLSNLVDRLAAQQRTGLVFVDGYGHRRDYTFAEISTHSRRYAAVLRAFGVRDGELAYVHLSATPKCVFTTLALLRLNARPTLDRSKANGASTVVSNRKYRESVDECRECFAADARYLIVGDECEGWARIDTLAQNASPLYGGTETVEHEALERARRDARERLGAEPTDLVWCALQVEDARWFRESIEQPWLSGSAAAIHDGAFEPRERLDLARELDVTILLQYAEEYAAELALPDVQGFKLPRLRRCLFIDAPEDESLQTQWTERFGISATAYATA